MKRLMALLLALMMMAPCVVAEDSPAARYEAAAALMVAGDYDGAAAAFAALTGYMDAPQMAIYCQALAWRQAGEHTLAAEAFGLIPGFKDADVQAACSWGMAEEAAAAGGDAKNELNHLRLAVEHYAPLQSLPWVAERARACRERVAQLERSIVDALGEAVDGMCIITRDGLQGVIDARGEFVLPCEWKKIHALGNGVAVVENADGVGVIGLDGKVLIPLKGTSFRDNCYNEYHNSCWELTGDGEKAYVCPAEKRIVRWDKTTLYLDSGWQSVLGEEGMGMMDPQGKLVVPCRYKEVILREQAGFIAADRYEKGYSSYDPADYDYYTLDGTPVDVPEGAYLALNLTAGGYWSRVYAEAKETGFIMPGDMEYGKRSSIRSVTGDFCFEAEGFIEVTRLIREDMYYQSCIVPGMYLADVWNGEGCTVSLLDSSGNVLFTEESGFIFQCYVEDRYLLTADDDDRYRIRDLQTGTYADVVFENERNYVEWSYNGGGVYYVDLYDRIAVCNLQGKVLLDGIGMRLRDNEDGLIAYEHVATGLCGVIDNQGNEVLPAEYKGVRLGDGLLCLQGSDGLWGAVDRSGNEVQPMVHANLGWSEACELFFLQDSEGLWGAVDRDGNEVLPMAYADFDWTDTGDLIFVQGSDGLWGAVDCNGRELMPMAYEDLEGSMSEWIIAFCAPNGSMVLTDLTGKKLMTVLPGDEVAFSQGCVYHLQGGLLTIRTVDDAAD